MLSLIRRRPLEVMLAGSVLVGWVVTFLSAMLPTSAVLLPIIAIPVSYVPALFAYAMLRLAGSPDERQAFRRRLTTFRVGARWYVLALLVLPLVHVAGVGIATLLGGVWSVHPAMIALLVMFLITNLGEEIGWRGYALPKLEERVSPLAAALILGFIWAVFHWVALLGNPETPWAYVAVSTVHLMAMSVIMSFVFNRARQAVPVVALLHATYDTVSIGVIPLIETGVPLLAFALTALIAWVVAGICIALGIGPEAREPRRSAALAASEA